MGRGHAFIAVNRIISNGLKDGRGQRESQHEVRHRQQRRLLVLQPVLSLLVLALGAFYPAHAVASFYFLPQIMPTLPIILG